MITRLESFTDISGLQYLTHITRLELENNSIVDVSPLADLTMLTYLDLHNNQIADTTPLHTLNLLTYLNADHNKITTIGPLTMASGSYAYYNYNYITAPALEPLRNNNNLNFIEVNYNFLNPADSAISAVDNTMSGQIRCADQMKFNIFYADSPYCTPDSVGLSDNYYNYDIGYMWVHNVDPAFTFMGWDGYGDDVLAFPWNVTPEPVIMPFTPPLSRISNINYDTHTADVTFHPIVLHNNADLGNPGNNRGTLTYYDATSHYDLVLDPWDRNVTLHPNLMEEHATYTIDGVSVASKTFNCNPGIPVEVTIKVTAQDGIHDRTYTVSISRDRPQLGKLAGLGHDVGTLDREFRPLTTYYILKLDEFTDHVTITPEKGYDIDIVSPASRTVNLPHKGDSKTVTFNVRSGVNRNVKTIYTVKVIRAKSANAQLQYIKVNGTDVSGFDPATLTGYTAAVSPWNRSSATVRVKAVESGSIVWIEGARTTLRTFTIRTVGGSRLVHIRVQSADRSITQEYAVNITRVPAPANADLDWIRVNSVDVPSFSPATTEYTVNIPWNKSSATVRAKADDSHAVVKINGVRTTLRTFGLANDETKDVEIRVTAADGTEKPYIVHIHREHPPTDATLSSIKVNGVDIAGFSPAITEYTVEIPWNRSTAAIRVNANEPHAVVKINGVRTILRIFPLRIDETRDITIRVTAADGTVIPYTLHIHRLPPV